MHHNNRRQDKPDESRLIDGELTDQLDRLIDHLEAVRWVDVPDLSATTAATFTRQVIEARQELLAQPRLIADGGEAAYTFSKKVHPEGDGTFDGPEGAAVAISGFPDDDIVMLDIETEYGQLGVELTPSEAERIMNNIDEGLAWIRQGGAAPEGR